MADYDEGYVSLEDAYRAPNLHQGRVDAIMRNAEPPSLFPEHISTRLGLERAAREMGESGLVDEMLRALG